VPQVGNVHFARKRPGRPGRTSPARPERSTAGTGVAETTAADHHGRSAGRPILILIETGLIEPQQAAARLTMNASGIAAHWP
jgi:hypothetical protein